MKTMNKRAFSMVEILVTVTIVSLMMAGGYAALSSGESSWFTAEAGIQVQESLRKALDQMTAELRQSKFSQISISQGTGFGSTDVITFSVPVICHAGDNLLDAAGDVAHWGATTKWGCRDAACMDMDDNCVFMEYKYIRYSVISGNLLERAVLNQINTVVSQVTIARNINDFQADLPNATSPLALTLSGRVSSVLNRAITVSVQSNVDIRNK
ncbi:MAG: prepilin-type N-terminal cleavage/methylation domain-containing protein [Candidatus Omnitrophica bacterium]|nr:prepilin-type N-terminal cleavage/methylation domain-containing protein [Candidatus Omnitrophota bacterium]